MRTPLFPPILPVLVPLVVAAIVLAVTFAYLFPATSQLPAPTARFADLTAESNLQLRGVPLALESPTTLSGAVIVLDYNGDGRPDLCFISGGPWPWQEQLAKEPGQSRIALFRNDGGMRFSDQTARAGLNVELHGMSGAAGDFDRDGHIDLLVTCVGGNHLFRNRGDGRFEDVTEGSGLEVESGTWSTAATWLDLDNDGRLDLVIANYARWSPEVPLELAFTVARVGRSYGTPTGFVSAFPSVYRNLGDGRFAPWPNSAGLRDVDAETGLPVSHPLAIVPLDHNGDGKLDLIFAYHTAPSTLFLNRGDGSFRKREVGRQDRHEGAATVVSTGFIPLGIGAADPRAQVFLAAAENAAAEPPIEGALRLATKYAVLPFDYDLDGRMEYLSSEALFESELNRLEEGRDFSGAPRVLWFDGVAWRQTAESSPAPSAGLVSRGNAVADFDGDGDLDVVFAQHNGQPVLWRNDQRSAFPWLRIRLAATRSAPDAPGAQVEVHTPRSVLRQTTMPTHSFLAQSETTLTFGLGDDARVRKVVVRWPSGETQEVRPTEVNQTLVIRQP